MTEQELEAYLFQKFPIENELCEWKEFSNLKHFVRGKEGEDVISYISAMSNMEGGSLIIGIEDKSFKIIGIQDFANYTKENIKKSFLDSCINISTVGLNVEEFTTSDTHKTVWAITIPKHQNRLPVYAHKKAWQRVGDSLMEMRTDRLKAILAESIIVDDWSAEVIPDATIRDLEPKAIEYAREKFIVKFPEFTEEIKFWDDITFLNKAKITIQGRITRTTVILLGKSEAEAFLIPSIAKIRWILKTVQNEEKDYEVFYPPFLLAIDRIYDKIRNLKFRYLPKGTLFPNELPRYEPFNIREAINNCVAHNDYAKAGYINVVEFEDDRLVFSNNGVFIPGSIEKVIKQDAPEENYRNRFLAGAMFQLGLVDTRGGGIKKMFNNQIKRLFPLPDYKFEEEKTRMTLTGKILDPEFSEILSHNPLLNFDIIFKLDCVQKKKIISDLDLKQLKKLGFIEGRKPNIFLSYSVVESLKNEDLKAEYITNRSFDDAHFKELILEYLKKFGKTKRSTIDNLIIPKLSTALNYEQKKNKVTNFLSALRMENKIESLPGYYWRII